MRMLRLIALFSLVALPVGAQEQPLPPLPDDPSIIHEPPTKERPVEGLVTFVNAAEGILEVSPMRFHVVPSVIDLDDVEVGMVARIYYQKSGDQLIALKVTTRTSAD